MLQIVTKHALKALEHNVTLLVKGNVMEMRGLKEIRKKKNINQLKLAFDLAISREAISHYENGNRNPSLEMLIALSDYFNVSIDYLIKGEEFQKKQ